MIVFASVIAIIFNVIALIDNYYKEKYIMQSVNALFIGYFINQLIHSI